MAISVELGPGIRFVAPRKSRKSARVSQPRRLTTSSSIMLMVRAGALASVAPHARIKSRQFEQRSSRLRALHWRATLYRHHSGNAWPGREFPDSRDATQILAASKYEERSRRKSRP